MLENRSTADDEKIEQLESMLKLATDHTNEAETKFDEVGLHCRQSVPSRSGPVRPDSPTQFSVLSLVRYAQQFKINPDFGVFELLLAPTRAVMSVKCAFCCCLVFIPCQTLNVKFYLRLCDVVSICNSFSDTPTSTSSLLLSVLVCSWIAVAGTFVAPICCVIPPASLS